MDKSGALRIAGEHGKRLTDVDGVVGVVLGGSYATGTAAPASDIDLGVYYRGALDVPAVEALAEELTGAPTPVAGPGGWGPWVDGGAWLTVDGQAVDWILRDLDRVEAMCDKAIRGEFGLHNQPGHPFGFLDITYAGELASSVIVADPHDLLAPQVLTEYPTALREAMVSWLWEAGFSLDIARKGAKKGDRVYVTMCLTRALGIMSHALCAIAGEWVLNEKGLVDRASWVPGAPKDFAVRAHQLVSSEGAGEESIDLAAALLTEVEAVTRAPLSLPPA